MTVFPLVILLVVMDSSVYGQQAMPFQVNSRESCATQLSLDTTTLTGIKRGDETAPCSGYLMYTDGGITSRMCVVTTSTGIDDYHAERACYTMGVNFYRDSTEFDPSTTRQMRLFKCFSYKEQGADSPEEGNNMIFDTEGLLDVTMETECTDRAANPDAYDCFDTCYFATSAPVLNSEESCTNAFPFLTIGCADINECETGVNDYCTGPFDTSCTIRRPCGNNTDCTNHAGSFECSCKNGFEYRSGDSFDPYDLNEGCKDVDECKVESKCDVNANCVNTIGSYTCSCKEGFVGDGKTCSPITCNAFPRLPHVEYKYQAYSHSYGDTVVCECDVGYKVSMQNLPETLVNYYGYMTNESFTLTCDENGDWGPYPIPQCIRVDCGDPGVIPDARRDGISFVFDQMVTYTCKDGFQPEKYGTIKYFTRKCQADGKWTNGSGCVDINECQQSDICKDDQHCVNTKGSYLCLDVLAVCDEGYCKYGKCHLKNGRPECVCDEGYTGYRCETPTMTTALILAIFAIVLLGLLIIIFCMVLCTKCCSTPHHTHPAAPPHGVVKPVIVRGIRFPNKAYGFRRPLSPLAP